jgi:hypothetical protein
MGKQDVLYELGDVMELDEGFFSTEEEYKEESLKRGTLQLR